MYFIKLVWCEHSTTPNQDKLFCILCIYLSHICVFVCLLCCTGYEQILIDEL